MKMQAYFVNFFCIIKYDYYKIIKHCVHKTMNSNDTSNHIIVINNTDGAVTI